MWRYDVLAAAMRRTGSMEGRMVTIVDVKGETAKLDMLKGRRPDMTEADRKGTNAFATLTPFRDGNIFAAKFSGNGAWERHPNGDELVQVVDGTTQLHIIIDDRKETHELRAGMLVVVPQGAWHRFEAPEGVCLMTATPKPTEHLTVDVADPRTLEPQRLSGSVEEKWR
jgi:mannose-6-phosphate isomerase-like protein (cupin superfamily)